MIWSLKPRSRGPYFQPLPKLAFLFSRRVEDHRIDEGCRLVMLTEPTTVEDAIADGMAELLICVIEFPSADLRDNLMPLVESVNGLQEMFDDALPKAFERARTVVRLIGTQTGAGLRSYFFMVEDPQAAARVLDGVAIPEGFTRRTELREDPQGFAEGWLQPDWFEVEEAKDHAVRANLAKYGDDGSGPRDTRFYFYGGELEPLAAEARTMGFTVEKTAKRDGLMLARDMEVTTEAMADLYPVFYDWVNRLGAEYDGWEAKIMMQ